MLRLTGRGDMGSSGSLFYNYFSFSAKKAIYRASEICDAIVRSSAERRRVEIAYRSLA